MDSDAAGMQLCVVRCQARVMAMRGFEGLAVAVGLRARNNQPSCRRCVPLHQAWPPHLRAASLHDAAHSGPSARPITGQSVQSTWLFS